MLIKPKQNAGYPEVTLRCRPPGWSIFGTKVHTWAILRAPNHGFPAGILHLAHMAPYGPTFVIKITSCDTPYSHIFHWERRLGIHEGHQIMHFHAYMQPSILTSRVSSVHSSISLMFAPLVKLMYWRVGGVAKTTAV